MQPNDITFYQRFETDILAGRKTITIRDKSESHFKVGDILRVGRFEDDQYFCTIEVLSVSPITLDELTEQHAMQENMGLDELKEVIQGIYPSESEFFVIEFKLLNLGKYMESNEVTVEKNDNFISRIKKLKKSTKFIIIGILGTIIVTSSWVYDTLESIQRDVWRLRNSMSSLNHEISHKTNDDYNYGYDNKGDKLSLKENLVLVKQMLSELDDKVDRLDNKIDRLDNKIDRLDNKIDELNSEFSLTNNEKDNKLSSSYSYNNIFDDKKEIKKTTLKDDLHAIKHQILEKKTSYNEEETLKDNIEEIKNKVKYMRMY